MKKLIAVAAALAVVAALAGCSAEQPKSTDNQTAGSSNTEQAQSYDKNGTAGEDAAEDAQGSAESDNQGSAQGGQGAASNATPDVGAAATANSIVTGKVWQYAYVPTEDDSATAAGMMTAICNELCKRDVEFYEQEDGMFPAVDLVHVADEEDGDIKAFGIFEIYNYELDGTKIVLKSGGRDMGCMHLALNSDGTYEVTKAEYAEDGANMQGSLETICEGYDLADSIIELGGVSDETRMQFIRNYVDKYGLDITACEDTDGTVTNL